MTTRTKIVLIITYTVVVAAMGAYLVPEKTKTEVKTVEVEKVVYRDKEDRTDKTHKHTTITKKTKPDGETETHIDVTYDDSKETKKDTSTTDTDSKKSDSTSETVKGDSKMTFSVLGGLDMKTMQPTFGASINKPILGPLGVGAWGLSCGAFGVSVGINL